MPRWRSAAATPPRPVCRRTGDAEGRSGRHGWRGCHQRRRAQVGCQAPSTLRGRALTSYREAIDRSSGRHAHGVNRETPTPGPAIEAAAVRNETQARSAPLAAYIAHELRTTLATQRALLELALTDPDADISVWRGIGRDVLAACKRQERVLAACITLGRGTAELDRREHVDLGRIVSELLRSTD